MYPGKGYRWLEIGELIAPGDQYWGNASKRWLGASVEVGDSASFPEHYRRRLEPKRHTHDVDSVIKRHTDATHARAKADLYA